MPIPALPPTPPLQLQNAAPSPAVDQLVAAATSLTDKMNSAPSFSTRSVLKSALAGAQLILGLGSPLVQGGPTLSCSSPQLSCHNTTLVEDLCCFSTPGGQLLQTQFWDTAPATGPADAWTVHGLWPDKCDGTYEANCDSSREHSGSNIRQILQSFGKTALLADMDKYWKDYKGNDESFWSHEWNKHGTCVNTMIPSCYQSYKSNEEVADYFDKTLALYKSLPTYQWLAEAGILPDSSKTYTAKQINDVLTAKHGRPVTIGCKSGQFNEVWYHFNVKGSVVSGQFVAADPDGLKSTCPSSGIKYKPKGNTTPSPTTIKTSVTRTSGTTSPTSTGGGGGSIPSGKGYLKVYVNGAEKGCVISSGVWYTTGTCATYTATADSSSFTLSSSKGRCAIADGVLTCASSVSSATPFGISGTDVAHDGGDAAWSAEKVPSGTQQVALQANGDAAVAVTIRFVAI